MRSMNSLRSEDEEEHKLKIIFVGDSGVGKTSIRQRFCQNRFDPFSVPTVGVQISTRKFISPFEEKQQKFITCFWDIVGEINNKQLTTSYFKNVIGVIYVFDLTSQESLDHLIFWKEKVQELTQHRFISFLLGNKKDLKQFREVEENTAIEFQESCEIAMYKEVSALQSLGGVQQAIYQYLTILEKEFTWSLKKPTRLKKPEAYHRSCI